MEEEQAGKPANVQGDFLDQPWPGDILVGECERLDWVKLTADGLMR